jgi:hypothetical protein
VRWKKARRQCYDDRRQRSSDRRRPPGGSAAWGGEGEGEVQLDWRREVHRGELTEAVATAALAASKPVTPTCLRRPVQTRCKGGGGSVEVVRGPVGEEMVRGGKGAMAGPPPLLKWARR